MDQSEGDIKITSKTTKKSANKDNMSLQIHLQDHHWQWQTVWQQKNQRFQLVYWNKINFVFVYHPNQTKSSKGKMEQTKHNKKAAQQ